VPPRIMRRHSKIRASYFFALALGDAAFAASSLRRI
jgi:hypothetical protein